MSTGADQDEGLRREVADGCRILARQGLASGILGHISARLPGGDLLIRGRGPAERGLARTTPSDVRRIRYGGEPAEDSAGWSPPKESPIHTVLMRRRPDVGAVVHAHPPAALLFGLAGLVARPVFGAFNIPAMRMARQPIPVYPRPVLITRDELGEDVAGAMGSSRVCILRGHGIVAVGPTVRSAVVAAVNLEQLCQVTVDLHRLGASPPELPPADLAELPDLGSSFDDDLVWQALLADADDPCCG